MRNSLIAIISLGICPLLVAQETRNHVSTISGLKMGSAFDPPVGKQDAPMNSLLRLVNAATGSTALSTRSFHTSSVASTPILQTVAFMDVLPLGVQANDQPAVANSAKQAVSSQATNGAPISAEITNADVVNMTKAGIGQETIVFAIQKGPTKFDTSAQALILLKAGGVSDLVLDAILVSNSKNETRATPSVDAEAIFQRSLNAIAPRERLATIRSIRWKGVQTQETQGGTHSTEREVIRIYPDSVYASMRATTGGVQKRVVTPDFNYRSSGNTTSVFPAAELEEYRKQLTFETLNIAKYSQDYTITYVGEEHIGTTPAAKLKISKSGEEVFWIVDLKTGRLISSRLPEASGELVTAFSDWRMVDGVYSAFTRTTTGPGGSYNLNITEYEINPPIDTNLFDRPIGHISQGLTLKVLQSQSVPYMQQSGGGISTSCSIVGASNTSSYATTLANTTYGNATTSSNQHMSCNSYDTTVNWPHILNVMFAEASDGNSYMFACDRAWRWSKCVPLQAGQVFNARFTGKGLEVESLSAKGKEESPTYHVLQSRSLR